MIKNRRLYHNGRGYFILFNENILNDVISRRELALTTTTTTINELMKSNKKQQNSTTRKKQISHSNHQQQPDATSLEPSVIGFKLFDSSRTSSSGQTDAPTTTDNLQTTDVDAGVGFEKRAGSKLRRHNSFDTLTEVTALADGVANISELYTPKLTRASFITSKIFRGGKTNTNSNNNNPKNKHNNSLLLSNTLPENNIKPNNSNKNNRFFCGTATDSLILPHDLITSSTPLAATRIPDITKPAIKTAIVRKNSKSNTDDTKIADSEGGAMSDTTDAQSVSNKSANRYRRRNNNKNKAIVKRSKTFVGGKNTDREKKNNKEVSFALIGSPKDDDNSSSGDNSDCDVKSSMDRFKRSHSFGVGYRKDKYQRPIVVSSTTGTNGEARHSSRTTSQKKDVGKTTRTVSASAVEGRQVNDRNYQETALSSYSSNDGHANKKNTTYSDSRRRHESERLDTDIGEGEEDTTYDDLETSFVDDSILPPVFDCDESNDPYYQQQQHGDFLYPDDAPDRENPSHRFRHVSSLSSTTTSSSSHSPDMRPIVEPVPMEVLGKYTDLGSALSLPTTVRNNGDLSGRGGVNFDVANLLSPTREESLAEELKQANSVHHVDSREYSSIDQSLSYTVTPKGPSSRSQGSASSRYADVTVETNESRSIRSAVRSPPSSRARRQHKGGAPYESQYLTDVLDQSQEICRALEDSRHFSGKNKDSNNNQSINNGSGHDGNKSTTSEIDNNKHENTRPISLESNDKATGDGYDKSRSSATNNSRALKDSKGVKMRTRAKSSSTLQSTDVERKRNQKERNSLLFEEKRASLKIMGLV